MYIQESLTNNGFFLSMMKDTTTKRCKQSQIMKKISGLLEKLIKLYDSMYLDQPTRGSK